MSLTAIQSTTTWKAGPASRAAGTHSAPYGCWTGIRHKTNAEADGRGLATTRTGPIVESGGSGLPRCNDGKRSRTIGSGAILTSPNSESQAANSKYSPARGPDRHSPTRTAAAIAATATGRRSARKKKRITTDPGAPLQRSRFYRPSRRAALDFHGWKTMLSAYEKTFPFDGLRCVCLGFRFRWRLLFG